MLYFHNLIPDIYNLSTKESIIKNVYHDHHTQMKYKTETKYFNVNATYQEKKYLHTIPHDRSK